MDSAGHARVDQLLRPLCASIDPNLTQLQFGRVFFSLFGNCRAKSGERKSSVFVLIGVDERILYPLPALQHVP